MVASARTWYSAMCWLSPSLVVVRLRARSRRAGRRTVRMDRLIVSEIRDGRIASMCEFELDDEEAAFAYAEERVRATASRLAVTNRASADVWTRSDRAMQAHDVDGVAAATSTIVRVRRSAAAGGNPIDDMRTAR